MGCLFLLPYIAIVALCYSCTLTHIWGDPCIANSETYFFEMAI